MASGSGGGVLPPISVRTLEILWHGCERDEEAVQLGLQGVAIEGIMSIDYHPHQDRIVTCGGDGHVRLWEMRPSAIDEWLANSQNDMTACVVYITGMRTAWMPLTARWSPHGTMIASAHCDGKICLWWPERRDDAKEEWKDYRHLSGHVIDVYDLCFSPDSRYLLSAGGDGSVVIHDLEGSTVPVVQLSEAHQRFCRGVAWDPWGRFVASFGGSPALLFYSHVPKTASKRMHLVGQRKAAGDFIGESCATTFRRFGWSPDGAIIAVPYGKASRACSKAPQSQPETRQEDEREKENKKEKEKEKEKEEKAEHGEEDDMVHCVYLYTRNAPEKAAGRLTVRGYSEVRGVLWAPCFLEPLGDAQRPDERRRELAARGAWGMDEYRMALAVWTADAVIVYTTDSAVRHSDYTDLHMRSISDVAWSPTARYLFTASLDGYVSVIAAGGSLGVAHRLPVFSKSPVAAAIARVRADIAASGAALEDSRRADTAAATSVAHVAVKKKRKVEKVQLNELEELMGNT